MIGIIDISDVFRWPLELVGKRHLRQLLLCFNGSVFRPADNFEPWAHRGVADDIHSLFVKIVGIEMLARLRRPSYYSKRLDLRNSAVDGGQFDLRITKSFSVLPSA